tara:strand:- start:2753 stop:3817 length:1065 start_codon:yes stop_codon:yes gene_type:complete
MQNPFLERNRRILVTGGGGFIGGTLIRRLLKDTDHIIFNLDKDGYASDFTGINNILTELPNKNNQYHFLKVDLSHQKYVHEAVAFSKPDFVFHLAAESHVDRSIKYPMDFVKSNILGTFNLLCSVKNHWEALNHSAREEFKFIHISTDEVFGSLGKSGLFSEQSPYRPRSPYSASKASSDHLVRSWNHTYGFPILISNCSNNFGPWQFPEKLIPLVILKAYNHEEIPLYGDGKNIRDWLYVEDHVQALIQLATIGKSGKTYCIGASNEWNNFDLIQLICSELNKLTSSDFDYKSLIKFVPDRLGHDQRYGIDNTLIKKELGWKPKYSFEEALTLTIKWYLENMNWCNSIGINYK